MQNNNVVCVVSCAHSYYKSWFDLQITKMYYTCSFFWQWNPHAQVVAHLHIAKHTHVHFGKQTHKLQFDDLQHNSHHFQCWQLKYAWHNESIENFGTCFKSQHASKPLNWDGRSSWSFKVLIMDEKSINMLDVNCSIITCMLQNKPSSI